MERKNGRHYDFSKLIKRIAILLIGIVIVNFGVSFFAMYSLSNEAWSYARTVVETNVREIRSALSAIDSNMISEVAYDTDLDIVQLNLSYQQLEQQKCIKRIKKLLVSWSHQYEFMTNYIISLPDSGVVINGCDTDADYARWRSINEQFLEEMEVRTQSNSHYRSQWDVITLDHQNYLVNYWKYDRRYICNIISLDEMLGVMTSAQLSDSSYVVLSNSSGMAYNHQSALTADGIDLAAYIGQETKNSLFEAHHIISIPIEGTDFYLNTIVKDYSKFINIFRIQMALGVAMAVVTVIYLYFMFYIRNTLIKPLQAFTENINQLKEDESYTVATHYQINELGNASYLLADMVEKIKGLKIDIYEKTLTEQNIRLDFLTLQIEPHFYLNCLNIIYNLAEIEQYKEIQRLSQCVSDYLRYMFKSNDTKVRFGDELCHIEKYLEIQKIRYRNGFAAEILVQPDARDVMIPPILVQTFVENALKHTINWDEEITIRLKAEVEDRDHQRFLNISIEDSGEGFNPHIMAQLNQGENISEGEKRIGIMNAIQRMRLAFGDEGRIHFYNCMPSGAGVYISLPAGRRWTEEEEEA